MKQKNCQLLRLNWLNKPNKKNSRNCFLLFFFVKKGLLNIELINKK
jgi:hypothetical protein